MPTFDALILGAGIVGAACADTLSREGLRVAVVERNKACCGATSAGMGHIVVMDDSEAQFALTRYSQKLWSNFAPELPPAAEYRQAGTLWIAAYDEEMEEVHRKQRYFEARGVPAAIVSPPELERLEHNLRKGLAGALLVSQDKIVHPPAAARLLLQLAGDRGASIFEGAEVRSAGNGTVDLLDGTKLSAGVIVNAAGPWASSLTEGIDVRKRKGYLVMTDPQPGFVKHQVVELGYLKSAHALEQDSVAFNIQPRSTGELLIGSSRQYGVEDGSVEDLMIDRMLERARDFMPALADVPVARSWAGFRAATPDKLPLIGRWPEDPSLFLATGHEGLGITTSLATAALLADEILNRPSAIPREPYRPARVLERSAKSTRKTGDLA